MAGTVSGGSQERRHSSGVGGPATYAGTNFQTLVGVSEVVAMLGDLQLHPWREATLAVEPRSVTAIRQVTYDLSLDVGQRRLEVKLAPTRTDVREFLTTVASDPRAQEGWRFELVHCRGSKAANDLRELIRAAHEAATEVEFESLVRLMPVDLREFLQLLGERRLTLLRSMAVEQHPEANLRQSIEWVTDRIYGEASARIVRDRLTVRIGSAAESRSVLDVKTLRDELAAEGTRPQFAPVADLSGLDEPIFAALAILAALAVPVPVAVLATVVGLDRNPLALELQPFVATMDVHGATSVMLATSLGAVSHPRRNQLLVETLSRLLELAEDSTRRQVALTQVRNIARLVEQTWEIDPALSARVFPVAEKLFKTTGNLHLALTTSRICLRASQRRPAGASRVTDQQLRDRAQTLVCGESWALQRIGQLEEADRLLQSSLELGTTLGWDRNTAFCLKCRGRLQRLRAEMEPSGSVTKGNLLSEAEGYLREAIKRFSESNEFGPDHSEVGDCKSLLARTLLVAGRHRDAWRELVAALSLLEGEHGQKHWADAAILEAELLFRDGDPRSAAIRLDEVLQAFHSGSDFDANEIAGRARALRGRVLTRVDPDRAVADHAAAAQIFEALEDVRRADEERWAQIMLSRELPPTLMGLVEDAPASVKVAAVAILDRDMGTSSGRTVGRRSGLTATRARQIAQEARIEGERRSLSWY